MKKNTIYCVLLASGNGLRFGKNVPKQFNKVAGKTIIEHTIDKFENNINIDKIIIVINENCRYIIEEIVMRNRYKKIYKIINGGNTRNESSYIGINAIKNDNDYVLIHDAVRPFVSDRIINECVVKLKEHDAIDVAIPSTDTIIRVNKENYIENIPERRFMLRGQTPQAFKVGLIKKAHNMAIADNKNFTDDCGLILEYNLAPVYVINGEERNIKITYPEDIFLADNLFQINNFNTIDNTQQINLVNKVLVVFGASRGIGKEIYNMAQDYGAKVFGFSRNNGCDISDYNKVYEALKFVFEKERRIDYVVNTAGILIMSALDNMSLSDISNEININYLGSINVVKASLNFLLESKGSILLFTSSSYSRGRALYSVYSSTKAAIVNLVQGLAEEFSETGVKINVVNPERTLTPMRVENFGIEDEESLLKPETVALTTLKTLMTNLTGQVIYIKKDDFDNSLS